MSELKTGKFWSRVERKKHWERSKERKIRHNQILAERNQRPSNQVSWFVRGMWAWRFQRSKLLLPLNRTNRRIFQPKWLFISQPSEYPMQMQDRNAAWKSSVRPDWTKLLKQRQGGGETDSQPIGSLITTFHLRLPARQHVWNEIYEHSTLKRRASPSWNKSVNTVLPTPGWSWTASLRKPEILK